MSRVSFYTRPYDRLEPYDGKLSRTVLRGGAGSNASLLPDKSSDIIDTLVYRLGLVNHQWSLSTAVGMMKSVVSFILVVISYRIASKHFDYQVF